MTARTWAASVAETPRYGQQTKARKAALDVLYSAELRDLGSSEVLEFTQTQSGAQARELTRAIIDGVAANRREIDQRITAALSAKWTLQRMPAIDRNLARIAVWELHYTDTPAGVVIAEAVKLAGDLSTDESSAFLNGLLVAVREDAANHD